MPVLNRRNTTIIAGITGAVVTIAGITIGVLTTTTDGPGEPSTAPATTVPFEQIGKLGTADLQVMTLIRDMDEDRTRLIVDVLITTHDTPETITASQVRIKSAKPDGSTSTVALLDGQFEIATLDEGKPVKKVTELLIPQNRRQRLALTFDQPIGYTDHPVLLIVGEDGAVTGFTVTRELDSVWVPPADEIPATND